MENKQILGQFYTVNNYWQKPHILNFINAVNPEIIIDPFCGESHLYNSLTLNSKIDYVGYDIEPKENAIYNDSLLKIPTVNKQKTLILTNPPYFQLIAMKRQKVFSQIHYKYFENTKYTDLYEVALAKCLEAADNIVAIVPQSILSVKSKIDLSRLAHITILYDKLFADTGHHVCVVCFDNVRRSSLHQTQIYLSSDHVCNLAEYESWRLEPTNKYKIKFNDPNGKLGLRAIDTTFDTDKIRFCHADDLKLNKTKICINSRNITKVSINVENIDYNKLIILCNNALVLYRIKTSDIILAPFRGCNNTGAPRRRLDYNTAKAIIEKQLDKLLK